MSTDGVDSGVNGVKNGVDEAAYERAKNESSWNATGCGVSAAS